MSSPSPFADITVTKLGIIYDPPSILVEYSAAPVYELKIVSKNILKGPNEKNDASYRHRHSIIHIDFFENKTDIETFKNHIKEQFPKFFRDVSDDQLIRLLSKLISNKRKIESRDDIFERNRVLPESIDYEYDKRRDFDVLLDECSWD